MSDGDDHPPQGVNVYAGAGVAGAHGRALGTRLRHDLPAGWSRSSWSPTDPARLRTSRSRAVDGRGETA